MTGASRPLEPGCRDGCQISWHPSSLDRDARWSAIGQRGATVLLTGLPAAGKSTIALELERRLVENGESAYVLDGDNIRRGLSEDLGFSPGDRSEHIRRVGHVAQLMADSGTIALVALISPMAADRASLRDAHEEAELPFVEVFVDTCVAECERRDPKGLYARALAGELTGFTGVDAPYEPPQQPELRVDTSTTSAHEAVSQIIEILQAQLRVSAKGASMRISAKADYAIRAAIELAAVPDGKAVPAERIATSQGIPHNFLEHILSELRIAGVVRSQRGAEGGYRLAKEPRLITIADIIRAVEGPLATVRGGKPEETEYPGVASQLPRVWIAVRKNLRNVVEHVTVADIANASLPESINVLADDPEAWVTR
ncbi:MAG TPA: adenylyl-sulfate kinase [Solirubrobacteraceae bacterium]|nr:adenylyl-sulfate kinase [Solirubrobacteraceae bacterium]